jgi:antirestriction protein
MNETATAHTQDQSTNTTPRIYVASLADYNAGRLLGLWIDADQEAEAIDEEIRAMLATSPEFIAEEWAIHDHEGFGSWSPREFESIETVATVARLIGEHGKVFAELLNHFGGDLKEAKSYMEDGYRGEYESLADYAETNIYDLYTSEMNRIPDEVRFAIDWEVVARECELGGAIFTVEVGNKVHVFDANL